MDKKIITILHWNFCLTGPMILFLWCPYISVRKRIFFPNNNRVQKSVLVSLVLGLWIWLTRVHVLKSNHIHPTELCLKGTILHWNFKSMAILGDIPRGTLPNSKGTFLITLCMLHNYTCFLFLYILPDPLCEYYRQVYFVHSGLQDESLHGSNHI